MITLTGLVIATLFLAYSNGANDNFKDVATLFGCGGFVLGSGQVSTATR